MESKLNREQWLELFKQSLIPWFAEHGNWAIPTNTKVTCGWPISGGAKALNPAVGQCFSEEASEGHINEIFISPRVADPVEVGAILVHELIHAIVGEAEKHHGQFKVLFNLMGLEGKTTESIPGSGLRAELQHIVDKLGPYPHSKIIALQKAKVQTTRQILARCDACGYTVRTTRKWLNKGAPICPTDPFETEDKGAADAHPALDSVTGQPIIRHMSYTIPTEEGEADDND